MQWRSKVSHAAMMAAAAVLCLGSSPGFGQSFRGIGGSKANEISADGSTVVGQNGQIASPGARAWRWSAPGGLTFLPPLAAGGRAAADGVSRDGSFVVGRSTGQATPVTIEAVRWDAANAALSLGEESGANAVSADGAVIAGSYYDPDLKAGLWTIGSGGTITQRQIVPYGSVFGANPSVTTVVGGALYLGTGIRDAFRWTEATGPVSLGQLPGDTYSDARDVSDDGRVVVGTSARDGGTGYQAFRWTDDGGMAGLGDLPGGIDFSIATTVSANGSVVGGFGNGASGPEYFLWTAGTGMRPLADVFRDAGLNFQGWQLTAPQFDRYATGWLKMSGNGLTFAGTGINPQGQQEAWVATIPEPACVSLLALGTLRLLLRRRRTQFS